MTKNRGGTPGGDRHSDSGGENTRRTDGSTVVEETRLSYEPDSVVSY